MKYETIEVLTLDRDWGFLPFVDETLTVEQKMRLDLIHNVVGPLLLEAVNIVMSQDDAEICRYDGFGPGGFTFFCRDKKTGEVIDDRINLDDLINDFHLILDL